MLTIHNQFCRFSCDPDRGLQWDALDFFRKNQSTGKNETISVIQPFNPGQNFFATGSFIMFPWVNRMSPNSYITEQFVRDGYGYPLHGLIHQNSWNISKKEECKFIATCEFEFKQNLDEKILLRKGKIEMAFELIGASLIIEGSVYNHSDDDWEIALGFHPYFQLGSDIESQVLQFNSPCKQVVLGKEMFPLIDGNKLSYHVLNERTICLENNHFDYLYEMEMGVDISYLDEFNRIGIRLKDLSQEISNKHAMTFHYLQVYTPEDRKSIALEPMSAPGNFENLPFCTSVTIEPGNKKKIKFSIGFFTS